MVKPLWADELARTLRDMLARSSSTDSSPTPPAHERGIGDTHRLDRSGDQLLERLLARERLARVPDGACSGRDPRDALLAPVLAALADAGLTLEGFGGCAKALRVILDAPPAAPIHVLAGDVLAIVREASRRSLALRHPAVRRALDILMAGATRWPEVALADEVGVSRAHFGRLVHDDTGLEYRDLRRHVLMKAAAVEVLTTDEQIAQIARRLRLHPGELDREFVETFGCSPRQLRFLWRRARP